MPIRADLPGAGAGGVPRRSHRECRRCIRRRPPPAPRTRRHPSSAARVPSPPTRPPTGSGRAFKTWVQEGPPRGRREARRADAAVDPDQERQVRRPHARRARQPPPFSSPLASLPPVSPGLCHRACSGRAAACDWPRAAGREWFDGRGAQAAFKQSGVTLPLEKHSGCAASLARRPRLLATAAPCSPRPRRAPAVVSTVSDLASSPSASATSGSWCAWAAAIAISSSTSPRPPSEAGP